MILGRVEGTVVCTVKHAKFAQRTLLVIQPLDEERQPQGRSLVAVDHAQAGEGDVVLVLKEGNGVRQLLKDPTSPIQALVVGVVDRVDRG